MIPGSDPKLRNEYVAIGAHNDHIGWSTRPVAHDSMYVVNHLFRTGGADDRAARLDSAQQAQVNALIADIRRRLATALRRAPTRSTTAPMTMAPAASARSRSPSTSPRRR